MVIEKEYPPKYKSLDDLLGNPELSPQKEFGSDLMTMGITWLTKVWSR